MKRKNFAFARFRPLAISIALCAAPTLAQADNYRNYGNSIELTPLGTFATGVFDDGAAEIVAYDPVNSRLFVVNGNAATIDVLDISDPGNPVALAPISVQREPEDAKANSVAVKNGIVAAAVENTNKQAPGAVIFFDTNGNFLKRVVVGNLSTSGGTVSALPDMVTFSPDGDWVLVANEGEPNANYTIDPEGSVSIIDLRYGVANATVTDVDFRAFNGASLDPSIRVFGPNATVAQDLEPEYIAISDDSSTAWVAIQENNAIATVDIASGSVTALRGLGFKDHSSGNNTLDASDVDGIINPTPWPVSGMYQPDSIVSYEVNGQTFLITANEGDAREYEGTPGFIEEAEVKTLTLDPTAFPNAVFLKQPFNMGNLTVTTTMGDHDNDGEYDELFSFGARSFSIWGTDGSVDMVFDSGDALERITVANFPNEMNSTNDENKSFDARSSSKGPEPEGLAVGEVNGRTYAFIGLERIGGIVVYDVSNPYHPSFVQYINTRDFSGDAKAGTAGDLAPEGLAFISAADSPTGQPLLAVAYEVSGTTTIFGIDQVVAEVDFGEVLCNDTMTGIFNRVVAVPGGTCTLSDAIVFGTVRAEPGSTLFVYGGGVFGGISGDPGSSVAVLSSFVGGNIRCEGAVAPSGCQVSGAFVGGSVRSEWADGGFVNFFSNYIDGNVRLSGNSVQSFVSLNVIDEDLTCRGNTPAPNPGGLPPTNDVDGDKRDQCDASFGF